MRFELKDFIYLVIIIIVSILGIIASFKEPRFVEIIARDTILVKEPVYFEAPAKVVYKTRTIFKNEKDTIVIKDSTNWLACIDTTIRKVDIKSCYEYPANRFLIDLKFQPDTVRIVNTIEKPFFKMESTKNQWWYDVAKIGGGVLVGFLLGRTK